MKRGRLRFGRFVLSALVASVAVEAGMAQAQTPQAAQQFAIDI